MFCQQCVQLMYEFVLGSGQGEYIGLSHFLEYFLMCASHMLQDMK